MKNFFLLLFAFVSLSALAQDSSKVKVTITLKAQQHYLIKDYIPTDDNPDRLAYYNQVAAQTDSVYQPNKPITVTVTAKLVVDVFEKMGLQPERMTAQINQAIKADLFPQIQGHTWILKRIQALSVAAQGDVVRRSLSGYYFYRSLLQQ